MFFFPRKETILEVVLKGLKRGELFQRLARVERVVIDSSECWVRLNIADDTVPPHSLHCCFGNSNVTLSAKNSK